MKRNAFTLIETCLTVALIILLIGLASLTARGKNENDIRNELFKFAKTVESIRRYTIEGAYNNKIKIIDENSYKIIYNDKEEIIKLRKISIHSSDYFEKEISFSLFGAPINSGKLVFKDIYERKHKVTIQPASGRVRVYIDEI